MGSEVKAVTTLSFEELAHKGTLLPLPLPLTIKFTPDSLPPSHIHTYSTCFAHPGNCCCRLICVQLSVNLVALAASAVRTSKNLGR